MRSVSSLWTISDVGAQIGYSTRVAKVGTAGPSRSGVPVRSFAGQINGGCGRWRRSRPAAVKLLHRSEFLSMLRGCSPWPQFFAELAVISLAISTAARGCLSPPWNAANQLVVGGSLRQRRRKRPTALSTSGQYAENNSRAHLTVRAECGTLSHGHASQPLGHLG